MAEVSLDEAVRLAFQFFQNGQTTEASDVCHQILLAVPHHFHALHLLGLCHLQRNDYAAAIRFIKQALDIQPNEAIALYNLGCAFEGLGQRGEAHGCYTRSISLNPQFAEAHFRLGTLLRESGHPDTALTCYDKALALRPSAATWNDRGIALCQLERFDDALVSFDMAITLQSNLVDAHSNRGIALTSLCRFDEALVSIDQAIALDKQYAKAWLNRGNLLKEMGRHEEALDNYQKASHLDNNLADAYFNRALTLIDLCQTEDALSDLSEAITRQPDNAEYRFSAAICHLLNGHDPDGWNAYEWRWKTRFVRENGKRTFEQPLWLGTPDIAGKILLLHAEQGLGDTLQFCRYATMAATAGARVILEVQPPLRKLLARLDGPSQVIAFGDVLPDFDAHCPLPSSPLAFGTTHSTIPASIPYLTANPEDLHRWKGMLGPANGHRRIGLVWAGNPRKEARHDKMDSQRSLHFEQLAPLLEIPGIDFISLQLGDAAMAQLHTSPLAGRVTDWSHALNDFSDTAALVTHLDLVICVDTSIAHLAGAMGKPFWLLNRFNTCWRWLLNREDSPWYPTARLFRQTRFGEWDDVIIRVAAALAVFAKNTTADASPSQSRALSSFENGHPDPE